MMISLPFPHPRQRFPNDGRHWSWALHFEPRDCWVGLYWTRKEFLLDYRSSVETGWLAREVLHFYICPLPTLVIHFWRARMVNPLEGAA